MKCLQPLLVCWCCLLGAPACSEVVIDGHSCLTDYWLTIMCVLNITENQVGHTESNYTLEFIWNDGLNYSCPLVMTNRSYSCSIVAHIGYKTFCNLDTFDIFLYHKSGHHVVEENFTPSKHIQLTPPHDVVVQRTPENFNITWKSGYESHDYLSDLLHYELKHSLRASRRTSDEVFPLSLETNTFSFKRSSLERDASYCIVVRSRPASSTYGATWSEWSQPTCWRTEASEASKRENIFVLLTKSVGPVCAAVGLLLFFLFFRPAARMRIKSWSHAPTPAPFFQPLFQQHQGNLKEWLSPQSNVILEYKTEESLKTDLVTVVPKPITKDPEEERDLRKSSVIQQCQMSYVGLPGMDVAFLPSDGVCPVDSSYTLLPCSTWGFGVAEVPVSTSSPEDFLDTSPEDSAVDSCGSSCGDPSQSTECSLPNSPVLASPPPCYCDQYCILNKTSQGMVPVLLSKNGRNVPSGDKPQVGES